MTPTSTRRDRDDYQKMFDTDFGWAALCAFQVGAGSVGAFASEVPTLIQRFSGYAPGLPAVLRSTTSLALAATGEQQPPPGGFDDDVLTPFSTVSVQPEAVSLSLLERLGQGLGVAAAAAFTALAGSRPGSAQAALVLARLTGVTLLKGRSVRVPVIFDRGVAGSSGILTLTECTNGPAGLFADPHTATLFSCQSSFSAALMNAWNLRPLPGRCILWHVSCDGRNVDAIKGGSMGAALAVGLDEMRRRTRVAGQLRLHRINERRTVSVRLNPDGRLRDVGGIRQKCEEARSIGHTLILHRDNEVDVLADDREHLTATPAEYVTNFGEVLRWSRQTDPRIKRLSGVLTVAAVVLAMVVTFIAAGVIRSNTSNHRQALRSKAESLINLAATTTPNSPRDIRTKALLLLTAAALARDADDAGLESHATAQLLDAPAGVQRRIDATIGLPLSTYVLPDQRLLETSEKGGVAIVDPSSGVVRGTYLEPPGHLNIDQPLPQAFALLPGTGIAAVVFQNQLTSGAGTHASLRIFSTRADLQVVGGVDNLTSDTVGAIGYSADGNRLIVASTSNVFVFSSNGYPNIVARCALPTGLGRPVHVDGTGSTAVITFADGTALSIADVETVSGSACAFTPYAPAFLDRPDNYSILSPTTSVSMDSSGTLTTVGLRGGQLAVRKGPSGQVRMLPTTGVTVDEVGPISDNQVSAQSGSSGSREVSVFSLDDDKQTANYKGEQLPAVSIDNTSYATSAAGLLDVLTTEGTAFPSGVVPVGLPTIAPAVAAGENSFALAYNGAIGVYPISSNGQIGSVIRLPEGLQLSAGDGQIGSTLSLSGDGRYLAAVVSPIGKQRYLAGRALKLWDTSTSLMIASPLAATDEADLLAVQFQPGTSRLLTASADGAVHAFDVGGSAPAQSVRAAVGGQQISAFVTTDDHYEFATYDPVRQTYTSVVRTSLRQPRDVEVWTVGTLDLHEPILVPLQDGSTLLVEGGGGAWHLSEGGTVGPRIDADSESVILSAVQLPGTTKVLLGTSRTSMTVDVASGSVDPGRSQFTLAQSTAVTGNSKYLVGGSTVITGQPFLGALTATEQSAYLCSFVDRDISRGEWSQYVGDLASYRPLCPAELTASSSLGSTSAASEHTPIPLVVDPADGVPASACSRLGGSSKGAQGDIRWGVASSGQSSQDVTVCVRNVPRWTVPSGPSLTLAGARVSGTDVLVLANTEVGRSDTDVDIVGTSGLLASFTAPSPHVEPAAGNDQIQMTPVIGAKSVDWILGADHQGFWGVVTETP